MSLRRTPGSPARSACALVRLAALSLGLGLPVTSWLSASEAPVNVESRSEARSETEAPDSIRSRSESSSEPTFADPGGSLSPSPAGRSTAGAQIALTFQDRGGSRTEARPGSQSQIPPRSQDRTEGRSASIPWRTSYAAAVAEAGAGNRPLWIQFTAPSCPGCIRMERDTLPHPAIRELAQRRFVPLKLRADVEPELALSFQLTGLPATVVLGPRREVVASHQGFLAAGELDRFLRQAASRLEPPFRPDRQRASDAEPQQEMVASEGAWRTAPPSEIEKAEPGLALFGYCPVSLITRRKLVRGRPEFAVSHDGLVYRLVDQDARDRFRANPGRFAPVVAGECPVTQLDEGAARPGSPRFGVLFQDRLFLCAGEPQRQAFLRNPTRYAAIDVAERGACPHCLARGGLRVPGDPRFELNRNGRRYWFPDATHRAEFLSVLDRSSEAARR